MSVLGKLLGLGAAAPEVALLPEPPRLEAAPEWPPVFYLDEPYGDVMGDPKVRYVQEGHQFGPDGRYVGEEPAGTPPPFDPHAIGRPRG